MTIGWKSLELAFLKKGDPKILTKSNKNYHHYPSSNHRQAMLTLKDTPIKCKLVYHTLFISRATVYQQTIKLSSQWPRTKWWVPVFGYITRGRKLFIYNTLKMLLISCHIHNSFCYIVIFNDQSNCTHKCTCMHHLPIATCYV